MTSVSFFKPHLALDGEYFGYPDIFFNARVSADGVISVRYRLAYEYTFGQYLWVGTLLPENSAAGTHNVAGMIAAAIKGGYFECKVIL